MAGILLPAGCCCGGCEIPQYVNVTISGVTGLYSFINGTHTLTNEDPTAPYTILRWKESISSPYVCYIAAYLTGFGLSQFKWEVSVVQNSPSRWATWKAIGYAGLSGCDPPPWEQDYEFSGVTPREDEYFGTFGSSSIEVSEY